jgi:hypothetical protein
MKKIFLMIVFSIFLSNLFGWGGLAHRIITQKAMENLPAEMNFPAAWRQYIIEHCTDPDIRKDETPGEEERHYIDIDFYEEFNRGEMITSKQELIDKYGVEKVIEMGVLPWAIMETYRNLVSAFQQKNFDDILLFSSDLAHYVEDASQPLHVILNYNGKLSNQRGIHSRYETVMIEMYEDELWQKLTLKPAEKMNLDLDSIFDYISDSNSLSPVIFAADLHALKYTQNHEEKYDEEYYKLLWFKTGYITKIRFEEAINVLSSLIYSAYLEAGHPQFFGR